MYGYSGYHVEEDTRLGIENLTTPIFIIGCGFQRLAGADCSMKRRRKDFYLVYLANGAGHFVFDSETITAEAGSLILYKPDEMQDYFYLGHEKAEIYWIHFSGSEAGKLLDDLSLLQIKICKVGTDPEVIGIFESIIHELQVKRLHYHPLCTGCFVQLLSVLSRKAAAQENGVQAIRSDSIEKAIRLMHEEYPVNRGIGYYAGICHLSVYQFTRSFKKATGFPPAKYLEKIRIGKAKEYLVNSSLPISEISALVGYSDAFYFSKAYKRVTNVPPSRFRAAEQPLQPTIFRGVP